MKKIENEDKIPKFNQKQIEKQLEKQIKFLNAIYPFLENTEWNDGAIELRPIKRDMTSKQYLRSYNTWRLEDKDKDSLRSFLGLLNGKGYCLYYSTYAFDFNKEVLNSSGKPYQKGKVNNQNALYTCILPMDFDNITEEEFKAEKQRLTDLGIETIDIFSGHGFQSLILLEHKVLDPHILAKFTDLMLSKGFKVDESIRDTARVLRMPYSFNCKALDPKSKHYDKDFPEIIPTTDVNWTEKRYKLVDVFQKINTLEDVIKQVNPLTVLDIATIQTKEIRPSLEKKNIEEVKNANIEVIRKEYEMLDIQSLPEPIQKMLSGSADGLRNKVMLFLIPFLRNSLGFSMQQIKEIMAIWGTRCTPRLDKDFVYGEVDRIYKLGFMGKFGEYTAELQKAYGYIEFTNYTRKNKIIIPNNFIQDYNVINDGAVKIYLALKLAENKENLKTFSQLEIIKYASISKSTFYRNVGDLLSMGYLCKKRANRRLGEEYIYYINPYFSSIAGFTMLENAVIDKMLKELTDGEIKLYSYLSRIVGDSTSSCWASQPLIAKRIGKGNASSISNMTNSLAEKKFIIKKTEKKGPIMHTTYNLLY